MASTCITSLDLCYIRVAKLTDAGAPDAGANHGYVSDAPITLEVSVTTEAGDDLTLKNGCGALAASFQQPDQIKGLELSLELCQLDAQLIELLTGAQVFVDTGDAIGYQLPAVGTELPPVCFEGWTKAWDVNQQLSHASTTPDATWIHWVFPLTRWVQGDFTLEHDLLVVPVNGKASENAQITANGPFDDWPAVIATYGGVTRLGGWFYDTPPTAGCDYVAVTSAAS